MQLTRLAILIIVLVGLALAARYSGMGRSAQARSSPTADLSH